MTKAKRQYIMMAARRKKPKIIPEKQFVLIAGGKAYGPFPTRRDATIKAYWIERSEGPLMGNVSILKLRPVIIG